MGRLQFRISAEREQFLFTLAAPLYTCSPPRPPTGTQLISSPWQVQNPCLAERATPVSGCQQEAYGKEAAESRAEDQAGGAAALLHLKK